MTYQRSQTEPTCPACGGTVLLPTRGGVPRGSCHCPTNRSREKEMTKTTQETPQASEPVTPKAATAKLIAFPAKAEARQVKVGSKVALAIDLLARHEGATLAEIERALSATGAKADPRAWVSFDVKNVGYGVSTDDEGRLHLVLPEGITAPLAHREAGAKSVPAATIQIVESEPKKKAKKAAMTSARSKKARKVAAK